MKKVTGKALSLVLSLALVVSSFPAIFASASTKTADGIISNTDKDKIYLVNGGANDDEKQTGDLKDWVEPTLVTKTRDDVDDVSIDAISHVSGDSLVTLKKDGDDDDTAYLKLKSKSVSGTEVISILYKGTYSDDDGNDYTIKARKNFTVYVFDEGQPVLGEKDSGVVNGKGLDDFKTFAKTRNSTKDVGLYTAQRAEGSALATYQPIYVTTHSEGLDMDTYGASNYDKIKDSAYYLEITNGDDNLHFVDQKGESFENNDKDKADTLYAVNADGNQLSAISGKDLADSSKLYGATVDSSKLADGSTTNVYTKDASTSNVTITLKKLKSNGGVSSDSDDKYTFKTKVDKKVDVAQLCANDSKQDSVSATKDNFEILKKDGKTRLVDVFDPESSEGDPTSDNRKYVDVTDSDLLFPSYTKTVDVGDDEDSINVKEVEGYVGSMSIGEDAHVGTIDIDGGTIEVNGKVGDITTDDKSGLTSDGSVTVKSTGSTGDIDTSDADSSASTGCVEIDGGTVGDVTVADKAGSTVTIDGEDSDEPIVTGTITASEMNIYSDEAKVTIGGIKANYDDGTLDIQGNNLTINSIDLDSYNTSLQIGDDDDDDKAFVGTLPEIKNASNATIKTENEDTKATIGGDLNVDTIDMDSDTQVTLTGNTTAATVEGDGTLTIPAGKLYVTDSVSSTKLKLSDSALAVGTTVFKAASDTVDEEDFDCYGFTLSKDEGNTVDTFKIASLNFAGMAISGGPSELVVGQSGTYTASAYPNGTAVPTGYTVEWDLDGGSSDVFAMTTSGNTATVKVNSLDTTFASENKTTLTATLYDEDGYEDEDYTPATFDIAAVSTPAVTSDTTGNLSVAQGATYQFKLTSSDGSQPTFTVGGSAFKVTPVGKSGNSYFYKITATGKVGDAVGVYVNGTRVAIATISAPSYKIDTGASLTVKTGATYTFKVTSSTKPTFTSGNSSVVSVVKSSASGTNYFFTVKGVKAGSTGVYVNGVRSTVVTVK